MFILFFVPLHIRFMGEWEKKGKHALEEGMENMYKIVKITMHRSEKNGNVKLTERRMAIDVL